MMDRRQLLTRLPLFSAAAVLPSVAAAFEAESLDLIQAAESFDVCLTTYDKARATKDTTRARYEAAVMPKPTHIEATGFRELKSGYHGLGYLAERETDVEGNDVWPDGRPPNYIAHAVLLEKELGYYDGRTATAKMLKHVLRAAQEYEASQKQAAEATGIAGDVEAFYWASEGLRRSLYDLASIPALTFYGLGVKATARLAVTNRDLTLWSGYGDTLLTQNVADIFARTGA